MIEASPPLIERLLNSHEPAIRRKIRVDVLGEPDDSPDVRRLSEETRTSPLVRSLLRLQGADGRILTYPHRGQSNAYQKWQGPHWTLVCLAEIGYPAGDRSLLPLRDQFYEWLFMPSHLRPPHTLVIPGQEDRVRRCGGQEGYAVWYSLRLGLNDDRTEKLVERLRGWQWPDGGWNCDKRPGARLSSLHETWIPIRALALHGRLRKDSRSLSAAARAAEVLLARSLFRSRRSGRVIAPAFTRLQYPHFIGDPRCAEALDLLESKRLRDGGFPLERRNFVRATSVVSRGTFADWGPSGRSRMNEFVTADALHILKAAGRLKG